MPPKISRHIIPPTGWKFLNGNFWIYGDNFNELVTNVRCHREANGFHVGNVALDVETQLTKNNPTFLVPK